MRQYVKRRCSAGAHVSSVGRDCSGSRVLRLRQIRQRRKGSGEPPACWGGTLPLCRSLLAAGRSGWLAFPIAVDLDLVHVRVHGIPWGFRVRVRVPLRCERVRLSFANAASPYPAAGLRRTRLPGTSRTYRQARPRFVIRHWSFVIPQFSDKQTPTEVTCAHRHGRRLSGAACRPTVPT